LGAISSQLLSTRRSNSLHLSRIKDTRESILDTVVGDLFRGGSDQPPGYNTNYINQGNYNGINTDINLEGQVDPDGDQGMAPQMFQHPVGQGEFTGGYNDEQLYPGQRESVEDRLAAWRLQQQVRYECILLLCVVKLISTTHNCPFYINSNFKSHYLQSKQPPPSMSKADSSYLQLYLVFQYHFSSSFLCGEQYTITNWRMPPLVHRKEYGQP